MCELNDLSILVIDDDEKDLDKICKILAKLGVDYLFCAKNKREFEAFVKSEVIDIALVDIVVGQENGFEFVRTLKAEKPECIVIMHTSNATPVAYTSALALGANGFIEKGTSSYEHDVIHTFGRYARAKRYIYKAQEILNRAGADHGPKCTESV